MARPIAATPTLSGSDAKRFIAATSDPQPFAPVLKHNSKALDRAKKALLERDKKRN